MVNNHHGWLLQELIRSSLRLNMPIKTHVSFLLWKRSNHFPLSFSSPGPFEEVHLFSTAALKSQLILQNPVSDCRAALQRWGKLNYIPVLLSSDGTKNKKIHFLSFKTKVKFLTLLIPFYKALVSILSWCFQQNQGIRSLILQFINFTCIYYAVQKILW